ECLRIADLMMAFGEQSRRSGNRVWQVYWEARCRPSQNTRRSPCFSPAWHWILGRERVSGFESEETAAFHSSLRGRDSEYEPAVTAWPPPPALPTLAPDAPTSPTAVGDSVRGRVRPGPSSWAWHRAPRMPATSESAPNSTPQEVRGQVLFYSLMIQG